MSFLGLRKFPAYRAPWCQRFSLQFKKPLENEIRVFRKVEKRVIYVVKQNVTISSSNVNRRPYFTHKFKTVTPKTQKNLPREAIAQNNDFASRF